MNNDKLYDKIIELHEQNTKQSAILGAVQQDTALMRKELFGNGQPGRLTILERDVQELKSNRRFADGVLYSISVGLSLLVSGLMTYGGTIYQFLFKRPQH